MTTLTTVGLLATTERGERPWLVFVSTMCAFALQFTIDVLGEPLAYLLALLMPNAPIVVVSMCTLLAARLFRLSTGIQNSYFVDHIREMPHPRSDRDERMRATFSLDEFIPVRTTLLAGVHAVVAIFISLYAPLSLLLAFIQSVNAAVLVDVILRLSIVVSSNYHWYLLMVLESAGTGKLTVVEVTNDGYVVYRLPATVTVYFTPQKGRRRTRRE